MFSPVAGVAGVSSVDRKLLNFSMLLYSFYFDNKLLNKSQFNAKHHVNPVPI